MPLATLKSCLDHPWKVALISLVATLETPRSPYKHCLVNVATLVAHQNAPPARKRIFHIVCPDFPSAIFHWPLPAEPGEIRSPRRKCPGPRLSTFFHVFPRFLTPKIARPNQPRPQEVLSSPPTNDRNFRVCHLPSRRAHPSRRGLGGDGSVLAKAGLPSRIGR
jgi:hypothetical protein